MLSRFISPTQVPCRKEKARLLDLFLKTPIRPGGFLVCLALSRPRAELLLVISEDLLQVKNCLGLFNLFKNMLSFTEILS